MVLCLGLGAGLVTGLGLSRWHGHPYRSPTLNYIWLVFLGFLPQLLVIYLGNKLATIPDWLAALSIVTSQLLLLIFAWLNRHLPGMLILIAGLVLNLAVMIANGGFMPINPHTAERIIGAERITSFELGSRIGYKDILLPAGGTRLEWLADRFLPPAWLPYQVAFSLGDIFIALGAFGILAFQKSNT
jgi:Family of unknown function (DUF5317)